MARNHGRIESAMWRDDGDWRALEVDAQWLYMALISQSDLSLAGVLHVSRRRWSRFAADLSTARLDAALSLLSDGRFLVVDEDTEEVLIRSFARRETQWGNPKRRGGLSSATRMINSPLIREVLSAELARVGRTLDGAELPPVSGNRSTNPPPIDDQSIDRPISTNRLTNRLGDVSRLPSPVSTDVDVEKSVEVRRTERGARLPDDFTITDDMRRWCVERGITKAQAEHSTEMFRNHWQAKTGKDATKLDWPATWRNWLLRDYPDRQPPSGPNADLNRQMGVR